MDLSAQDKEASGQGAKKSRQDGSGSRQNTGSRLGKYLAGQQGRELSEKLWGKLLRLVAVVWLSLGILLCPAGPSAFVADAHAISSLEAAAIRDKTAQNPGKDGRKQQDGAVESLQGQRAFSHVFGTLSIRRPMNLFPFWQSVLKRNAEHPVFQDETKMGRQTWGNIRKKASTLKGLELVRYVNSLWNAFPYVEDIVNWGRRDYWEAPYEFLQKSGDCEDYAIIKYMTLRQLGVPADDMRILVVKDTFRSLDHAVLGVNVDGTVYILDNLSNVVLSHGRLTQYHPEFSVNENNAWMHLRPRKAKKPARRAPIPKLVSSTDPDHCACPEFPPAIADMVVGAPRVPAS